MYTSALHLTNDALRNPEIAVTDATLISMLLLGLYETNTCNAPPSMRAWLKHINGATALLELRGKRQLNTALGRSLFAHLRLQIVNYCILRRKAIPSAIGELSEMCPLFDDPAENDPATQMTAINMQLCSLRAQIGHRPPETCVLTPERIISEALSIAGKPKDWNDKLPPDHLPTSTIKTYS